MGMRADATIQLSDLVVTARGGGAIGAGSIRACTERFVSSHLMLLKRDRGRPRSSGADPVP